MAIGPTWTQIGVRSTCANSLIRRAWVGKSYVARSRSKAEGMNTLVHVAIIAFCGKEVESSQV